MNDPDVKRAIADGDVALWHYIMDQHSDKVTWKDVKWLKSLTKLPVVAKGILTGKFVLHLCKFRTCIRRWNKEFQAFREGLL